MKLKVPAENLVIHNAKITYRNFAGAEGQFNPAGARSFAVQIGSLEEAEQLASLGWKVKLKKPREDGEDHEYPATLPVALKYHPKVKPPVVRMITSRGQTNLDEGSVEHLDFMDIANCDLIIRPFHWQLKSGSEGVKNMLVSIYITIREDELELKYADVPMVSAGGGRLALESYSDTWGDGLEDLGEVHEQRAIGAGF